MSDERRSSETLLLDAKKYATKLTVTAEEVKLLFEERKDLLKEPEQRYIQQILVDNKDKAEKIFKKLNKSNFITVAQEMANLTEDDIDLGWNTKSEIPEEIVENVFKISINEFSEPLESTFGWHIVKIIDIKEKKKRNMKKLKKNSKKEILLDKGKEAVYDLQDELEDLLASGSTFEEISKILDVKLIKSDKIDNKGINPDGKVNKDYQDERVLRSVFNQKVK